MAQQTPEQYLEAKKKWADAQQKYETDKKQFLSTFKTPWQCEKCGKADNDSLPFDRKCDSSTFCQSLYLQCNACQNLQKLNLECPSKNVVFNGKQFRTSRCASCGCKSYLPKDIGGIMCSCGHLGSYHISMVHTPDEYDPQQ